MSPRKLFFAVLSLPLLAGSAHSASVVWSSPTTISGNSDVSTAGTLVQASNIGDANTPATTVNGVTFNPWVMNGSSSTTSGQFTLSGVGFGIAGFNGYGSASAPFSNLSSAYQNLLAYGNYGSGNSPMTLTISGLIIGMTYQFQVWINDSRAQYGNQTVTASAGNSVAMMGDTTSAAGGVGQFAIGTFTADALMQVITFTGGSGQGTTEEAFQLRLLPSTPSAAPEAGSSIALLAVGLGGLMGARRFFSRGARA